MVNQTLKQEIMALEADFCAALSDPTRIFILYALSEKPLNVTELTNELSIPQPTTSRHLKVLRDRRLVLEQARSEANIGREIAVSEVADLTLLREAQRELGTKGK